MYIENNERNKPTQEFTHKEVLQNGLELLVHEMPWAQSVTARLLVKAGLQYEDEDKLGITHFIEHMLLEGSGNYPSRRALDRAIESKGGMRKNYTFEEYAKYEVKVPFENVEFSTEYLRDYVHNPLMLDEAVARERGIITADLRSHQDIPSIHRHSLLREHLWKGHPLGRNPIGTVESIQRITQQDLVDYHSRFFRPDNELLVIAGNIQIPQAIDLVERDFGDLSAPSSSYPIIQPATYTGDTRVTIEERNIHQTHILLTFSTNEIGKNSPLLPNAQILARLVRNSIFHRFVYDEGLSYFAGGYSWFLRDSGCIVGVVEVNPKDTDKAVELTVRELNNLKVDDTSLQEAKAAILSESFLNLADTDDFTHFISEQQLFKDEVKSPLQVKNLLQRVTTDEVSRLKQDLFVDSNVGLVILGPVSGDKMEMFDQKLAFR